MRRLGVDPDRATLRFGEAARRTGEWAGRRLLLLGDQPAFELSYWCGTCPVLFQRLDGANRTFSIEELDLTLSAGLDELDESVIEAFGSLLPDGEYLPILLGITPQLVHPAGQGDYFTEEQVVTWGVDSFWGLPRYPHTPYYRTFETAVSEDAHLYEFVVPMVPPTWLDPVRTLHYADTLRDSAKPTAVALSTLDVCQPAIGGTDRDPYAHWALTHFLLDGHHKLNAAARSGHALQLLCLLSLDGSLADEIDLDRLPSIRAQAAAHRART